MFDHFWAAVVYHLAWLAVAVWFFWRLEAEGADPTSHETEDRDG